MSDKLKDPSKAAHEIIDWQDGDAIRNDGVRLQAANKNPWYVLATIYGEQKEGATWYSYDEELAAKNRRAWNGWYCGGLSDEDRADRAKKAGVEPEELAPLSEAELDEISKRFAARMGKGAKPPPNDQDINFSNTIFLKFLCFEKFIFAKPSDFRQSVFCGLTDFNQSVFQETVRFEKVRFVCSVDFCYTRFCGGVSYDNTLFYGSDRFYNNSKNYTKAAYKVKQKNKYTPFDSIMDMGSADIKIYGQGGENEISASERDNEYDQDNGSVDFRSAIFEGDVSFEKSDTSSNAFFQKVNFKGIVSFSLSKHHRNVDFSGAKFNGRLNFHRALIKNNAGFRSVDFDDKAVFSHANLGGNVFFDFTMFNGAADFVSTTFGKQAKFNSAKFKSTTNFTGARFLTSVPQFHAAQLYDDTVFSCKDADLGKWPPLRGPVTVEGKEREVMPAAEQKRAYNRLRLFMNKSLQLDEEQFFHRMEMRCKTKLASWYHKPLYWFYGGLSDFGNSVVRPIVGIIAVICLGAYAFAPQEAGVDWTFGLMGKEDSLAEARNAFGWSVSNTLPFLGFGRLYYGHDFAAGLDWPLRVVGGVQTLLGYILLFLMGLGLRNRFRLR